MGKDRAYVLIAGWPDALSGEDERAAVLMHALEMDEYRAGLAGRRETPCFAARIDPSQSMRAATVLWGAGVRAAVASWEQISARLEGLRLRALEPAIGAPEAMFMATPWKGQARGVRASEVRLLVRGRTRVTRAKGTDPNPLANFATTRYEPISGMPIPEDPVRRELRVKVTEVLDVHLSDGMVLRCDASRFSFQFMGDSLGLSDTENLDTLAGLVARAAPGAAIDTGFSQAAYMSEYTGDFMSIRAASGGTDRHGMLAFSVYSAGLGLLDAWDRPAGAGEKRIP